MRSRRPPAGRLSDLLRHVIQVAKASCSGLACENRNDKARGDTRFTTGGASMRLGWRRAWDVFMTS